MSGRVSLISVDCSSNPNIVAGDSIWSQNFRILAKWAAGNEIPFAVALIDRNIRVVQTELVFVSSVSSEIKSFTEMIPRQA